MENKNVIKEFRLHENEGLVRNRDLNPKGETNKKKRIFLASPHMGGHEMRFIEEAFETNWIAPLGPNVEGFEKEVAQYVGIEAALALTSGTDAIHMALKLVGTKPEDLIFCSTLTFVATCNPIIYEGAVPVFIDSEPESLNMCPKSLEKAFKYYEKEGRKPKAVIVVHLYGQTAQMEEIREICDKYQVPIIEDAAEALGATYKGAYAGTLGDYGILSFNGNKIITTSGGGMLLSKDKEALKKALFWSTQARDTAKHYQHSQVGYNYRMSNVLAGIGRGQLLVLEERIEKKKKIFETYKWALAGIKEISMTNICDYGRSNYWLSTMTISKDSKVKGIDIINELEKENIESRPIWKPMHMQPLFENYKFFKDTEVGTSVAQDVFERGICLPSDTKMTMQEQMKIISIIRNLFAY